MRGVGFVVPYGAIAGSFTLLVCFRGDLDSAKTCCDDGAGYAFMRARSIEARSIEARSSFSTIGVREGKGGRDDGAGYAFMRARSIEARSIEARSSFSTIGVREGKGGRMRVVTSGASGYSRLSTIVVRDGNARIRVIAPVPEGCEAFKTLGARAASCP